MPGKAINACASPELLSIINLDLRLKMESSDTCNSLKRTLTEHGRSRVHLRREHEHTLQTGMNFKYLVLAVQRAYLGQYAVWVGFVHPVKAGAAEASLLLLAYAA